MCFVGVERHLLGVEGRGPVLLHSPLDVSHEQCLLLLRGLGAAKRTVAVSGREIPRVELPSPTAITSRACFINSSSAWRERRDTGLFVRRRARDKRVRFLLQERMPSG